MTSPSYSAAIQSEYNSRNVYNEYLVNDEPLLKNLVIRKAHVLMAVGGAIGALFGFVGPWKAHPTFGLFMLAISIGMPTLRALGQSKNGPILFCSTLLYMPVNEEALGEPLSMLQHGPSEHVVALDGDEQVSRSLVAYEQEQQQHGSGRHLLPTAKSFVPETMLFSTGYFYQVLEHVWVSVLALLLAQLSNSWVFGMLAMVEYYYVRYYLLQNRQESMASVVQDLKFHTCWIWGLAVCLALVVQWCMAEDKELFPYFTYDFIWQFFDLSAENPRSKTQFIGTVDAKAEEAKAALKRTGWVDTLRATVSAATLGVLSGKVYADQIEAENARWGQLHATVARGELDGALRTILPAPIIPPLEKVQGFTRGRHWTLPSRQGSEPLKSPSAMELEEEVRLGIAQKAFRVREAQEELETLKRVEEERVREEQKRKHEQEARENETRRRRSLQAERKRREEEEKLLRQSRAEKKRQQEGLRLQRRREHEEEEKRRQLEQEEEGRKQSEKSPFTRAKEKTRGFLRGYFF